MLKQTVVVFKPDLAYCYGAKRVTVNCHQQVIKGYGHVLGIDLCDSSSWCLSAERQDEADRPNAWNRHSSPLLHQGYINNRKTIQS